MRGRRQPPLLAMVALVLAAVGWSCERAPTGLGGDRTLWRVDGLNWGKPTFDDSNAFFVGWHHDLVAVNKFTGAVRWRQVSGDPGDEPGGRTAVVAANVVAFGDNGVHGFDRRTGAKLWRFQPTDGGYQPGLVQLSTDGSAIFAGSPFGRAFAIDAVTGAERWRTVVIPEDSNAWVNDPVYSEGLVYVCVTHKATPTNSGDVALDAATGAIRWTREFPLEPPNNRGACYRHITRAGDLVIGVSKDMWL